MQEELQAKKNAKEALAKELAQQQFLSQARDYNSQYDFEEENPLTASQAKKLEEQYTIERIMCLRFRGDLYRY